MWWPDPATASIAMLKKQRDEIHTIQLETTSRCNLDCTTCLKPPYSHVWQEHDMDIHLFNRILSQLPSKVSVHLQGWGEPLLHPDTLVHIGRLKAAGAIVSFTTNGTVMDRKMATSLIESGLDGLTFSMVGNSSNCQDKLRGAGSFAHLQNSIRTLCAARDFNSGSLPKVAVSYLLTPESVFEMAGAASWCRKNGVDAFVTVHLTQASCENQQKLQLMFLGKVPWRYRLLKAQTYLSAILGKMHLEYGQFRPTLTPVCDKNPLNCVFIRATGDVSPCVYLSPPVSEDVAWLYKGVEWRQKPLIFGNIKETSLMEIWERPEYCYFRESFRTRKGYHDDKLADISYSLEGSVALENAVKDISEYFASHPSPEACRCCAKLDGF